MRAKVLATIAVAAFLAGCGSGSSSHATGTAHSASTQALNASSITARLQTQVPTMNHVIVYNAVTDPNHLLGRQGGYTSKVAWQDSRAIAAGAGHPSTASDYGGIQYGGGIEVFPTVAGARARYQELRGFTAPLGDGYDYVDGSGVLRLSQYLTPAQAQSYAAVFDAIP
jgi:hypothetical protein